MNDKTELMPAVRKTSQSTLPQHLDRTSLNSYDMCPFHGIGTGKIFRGYNTLADWIVAQKTVMIDGFTGVFWDEAKQELEAAFAERDLKVNWILTDDHLKSASAIQEMVNPFLGTEDSVWGTKAALTLADFFEPGSLQQVKADNHTAINIVLGTGAALAGWKAPLIYLDLPKNELQYRMRAGSVHNLGNNKVESPFIMYKRYYFVDWVVLNAHKQNILNTVEILADSQWQDTINWSFSRDIFAGMKKMSSSVFRVRPWFEAGAWGGQWLKEQVKDLNKDEVNYAWSFEMIVPENGVVFESDGNLLELSFDFLMYAQYRDILGKHAEIFKTEFPIRFDFLDTWDGGNLSIQCHPSLSYIRREFGENLTQDETYYILDCKEDANVYLGFQEDINPTAFRKALEESQELKQEIDISEYVQVLDAAKHDLFLIPNGTVHSAGSNNLVLEISATPYIFTFKMYDWLRLDLNGEPRPINIDHAFNNLNFERKGDVVKDTLISKQSVISSGEDWNLVHLPTHAAQFYDIHRMEFDTAVTIETNNVCHILMLVEGTTVGIVTADGSDCEFHYAETFVVPAAAKSYTLRNKGNNRAKVIKAFVKDEVNLRED